MLCDNVHVDIFRLIETKLLCMRKYENKITCYMIKFYFKHVSIMQKLQALRLPLRLDNQIKDLPPSSPFVISLKKLICARLMLAAL